MNLLIQTLYHRRINPTNYDQLRRARPASAESARRGAHDDHGVRDAVREQHRVRRAQGTRGRAEAHRPGSQAARAGDGQERAAAAGGEPEEHHREHAGAQRAEERRRGARALRGRKYHQLLSSSFIVLFVVLFVVLCLQLEKLMKGNESVKLQLETMLSAPKK